MGFYAKSLGNDIFNSFISRANINRSVESYLKFMDGNTKNISGLTKDIVRLPYVEAVILAPKDRITEVYSQGDYSQIIGMDIKEQSFGGELIPNNLDDYNLYISGPFEYNNGKQLVVVRLPIYLDAEKSGDKYWGVVGLGLSYSDIMNTIDISGLKSNGYEALVWRTNPNDGEKQYIFGNIEAYADREDYIEYKLNIMNADWYIQIIPKSEVSDFLVLIGLLFACLASSLIAALWLYKYLCSRDTRYFQKKAEFDRQYLGVMTLLSSEYSSVYYVYLDTNTVIPYSMSNRITGMFGEAFKKMNYSDAVELYIEKAVVGGQKELVKSYLDVNYIKNQLKTQQSFVRHYLNNDNKYCEYKCVRVDEKNVNNVVVMGFAEKDTQIRSEIEYQEELKEARQKAEAASVAKSTFLFNMSHDIRTPMNAIMGYTQMALKHIDDREKVEDCLEKVSISGDHLRRLINDILDVARIENGKIVINESVIDIREMIKEMRAIVSEHVQEKNLRFKHFLDVKYVYIYVDRLRASQIVLNILSNAIKFTPEGGNIFCSLVQDDADKDGYSRITFTVKDNGCGMSKEFQEHIFEAFVRERSNTVSGVQGTGLGMAITKQLIDKMGGEITIDSDVGIGTKVVVSMKCKISGSAGGYHMSDEYLSGEQKEIPEDTDKTDIIDNSDNSDKNGNSDNADKNDKIRNLLNAISDADEQPITEKVLKGKRILVVEDNKMNMEITCCILEDEGIIFETAENGIIAVDMVRNNPPEYYDLILMDIQMPVMDGCEATLKIRGLPDPRYRDIPIVAMTANAYEENRKASLDVGMLGHLTKPIDIYEMTETIKEFIR